jgi:aryl-alcohol dehydrogenase-like predicted oxidoreductase
MGALLDLKTAGKVRAIGVSNFTPPMMAEAQQALGDVPLASDQPKYNLVSREIEKDVLPWCREHDVSVVVYSPLDQGLLTGKVPAERAFDTNDGRHKRPTFATTNRARVNDVLARVVQPIATRHSATIAQVVLAWTVAQPGITSAIAGARTPEQSLENARAGDLTLSPKEIAEIRDAFESLELDVPSASKLKRFVKRLLGR